MLLNRVYVVEYFSSDIPSYGKNMLQAGVAKGYARPWRSNRG